MKEMKRWLALLLCVVMLIGIVPVNAIAAEETIDNTTSVAAEIGDPTEDTTEGPSEETTAPSSEPEGTTAPSSEATEPEGTTAPSSEPTAPEGTTAPTGSSKPQEIAVTGITLDVTELELEVAGLPVTLTATVTPEDATDKTVVWKSSDEMVATVDEYGNVTPGCQGETVITATAGKFSATCTVKVVLNEDNITGYATGDTTYVLACSDFQASSDSAGANNVKAILAAIRNDYSTMDGFLFGGDLSQSVSTSASASGKTALQGALATYYTNVDEVYVQGNHDPDDTVGSTCSASGAHDTDAYGVYVINEKDYPWGFYESANSSTYKSTVQATADKLDAYLDAKVVAEYSKPIFVASHIPLHYTTRTSGQNDAMHANLLFNVLNEAGAKGLNIIFLFGHNHSTAYDSYLGQGAIYLAEGDKINIAQNSTTSYKEETLNFTYMNYGYVGYIGSTDADSTLTMTVFEITDDQVSVKRYDEDGVHDLKAAGGSTSKPSNISVNSTVYSSPQTIALTTPVADGTEGDSGSGDSGSGDSGNTGGSTGGSGSYIYELVTEIEAGEKYVIVGNDDAVALMDNGGSMDSQSVTISGTTLTSDVALTQWTFSSASSGTITSDSGNQLGYSSSSWNLTGSGDCDFNIATGSSNFSLRVVRSNSYSSRYYFYYDGSAWAKDSSNTQYVRLYKLTGTGSGGTTVTPEGGDWVTISNGSGGTTYTLTDSLEAGKEYLVVSANSGSGYALQNPGVSSGSVSMGATAVEIQSGTTPYITTEATDIVWTATESGSVIKLINNNNYLEGKSGGVKIYTTSQYSDRGWEYESNQLKYTGGSNTYIVYYDDGFTYTYGSTSNKVYLFEKTGTVDAGDAEYAKLDGSLTYPVSRGASAEEALAAVKAGINVLTSANADGSDPTTLDDSNTDITWTLSSNYDGSVPGEYAVTISYKGVKLGVAKVVVPEVTITGYDCQTSGSVKVGATGNVRTGANITVKLEDGTSYTVPVTVNMLTKDGAAVSTAEGGVITGITVTYNGVVVCENFTLTVREPSSYPEYPDEGAVKVNKTGTGVEFQSTGVAQVEISASGIPMNQGVDVLLILDTSSSMGESGSLSSGTRMSVLQECVNALIQNLKAERADGSVPDVDFSVVDFAGYLGYKEENYIGSTAKSTSDAQLGKVLLDWTNVQNVSDTWANSLVEKSGTNYDHGLEMGYNQLQAKQGTDAGTRKQFVLFMSDGAPFQYNGVGSSETGEGNEFEKWLLGTYTQDEVNAISTINDPNFYFESEGGAQKNRIAEAIKGSSAETFYIPSYTQTNGSWEGELVGVPGLGATMYSVGYALVEDYGKNPTGLNGMNAILNTIASVSSETGKKLFYPVTTKEDLVECFDDFAGEALMSATNARFVDQMGDAYDLKMGAITDLQNNDIGVENKIEVLSYEIYTRADYLAGRVTADKIGDRKDTDPTPLETVTFKADGTEAYSSLDSTGPNGETIAAGQNILIDGVIYANTFWYNTNHSSVTIDGVDIPTGVDANGLTTGSTNVLPGETFYWKVGTIKTTELAMRYYVYLTGSKEGTREAGSYPTNNYANLYYNNYLNQPAGQPCQKITFSPILAWEAANVSYAFYLVDENGNIVVNQTTGETGSFANKIAVTNPVVHKEVLLNNTDTVESIEVASSGVLPTGYELYDAAAVYTIEINSDATGSWNIVKGEEVASTYVTQYDPSNAAAYTNELTRDSNADFTHTVVWFAVLWKIQALPDTVVIDYGLPVDISVLRNDMFGEAGKLAGIGSVENAQAAAGTDLNGHTTALESGFGENYTGVYGSAKADASTGKVHYTLNTSNGMQMETYEKFAYAVNYTGATNPGYYYDTVTVIPATTIYYEDSFLTFDATNTAWADEGTAIEGAVQAEDRPGSYSLTDANNIYGYDGVNLGMSTFSLGTAKKVHVDANSSATASFTFKGTGFDVISMTSNKTGVLAVQVTAAEDVVVNGETKHTAGTKVKSVMVNTYYGYSYTDGQWVPVDSNDPNALYQVPIIQIEELPYGKYSVVMTATYASALDKTGDGGYDLYVDAIRIYDPANNGAQDQDSVIENAYKADGEGWPTYIELRNKIIAASSFDNVANEALAQDIEGLVFIDGDASVGNAQISDYVSYGPNNEVYLAPGQRVAFVVSAPSNIANIHLGVKSADGKTGTYTIANIAKADIESDAGKVEKGKYYGEKTYTVSTTTDMYYDITGWDGDIIVITNAGATNDANAGIISLTNIKSTYTSDPNGTNTAQVQTLSLTENTAPDFGSHETYIYMTPAAATLTLRSLNGSAEEDVPDETVPEETTPETTEPEDTLPEDTEPEETVPETTEPEVTEPEATEPEEEKPEVEKVIQKIVKTVREIIKNLFGGWFR